MDRSVASVSAYPLGRSPSENLVGERPANTAAVGAGGPHGPMSQEREVGQLFGRDSPVFRVQGVEFSERLTG
jgi:hypothetical protein